MSEERPFEVRVEPERLPRNFLLAVLTGTVLVIGISLVVVRWWAGPPQVVDTTIHGPAPREISRVEQTLIDTDPVTREARDTAERRLSSYEWVDRDRGLVRIPLERAFDLMTGGAK